MKAWSRESWIYYRAPALWSFALFFLFLLASNSSDWDYFFSTFATDLRSWLLDLSPPLWSYQFCAGISRLGDPQAFGLSPLFLLPLLLGANRGAYWGSKLVVFACAFIGHLYHRRLLELFLREHERESLRIEVGLISLLFIFSQYFLWHFHSGHITFALDYLALGMLYHLLHSLWSPAPPAWKSVLAGNLLSWSYFSAGFYHSFVFFLLPLSFACVLLLGIWGWRRRHRRRDMLRGVGRVAAVLLPGFLLASYKWIGVIQHQQHFPRTLSRLETERGDVLRDFIYQMVPTLDQKFPAWAHSWIVSHGGDKWGHWEYSSFGLLPYLLLLILPIFLWRRGKASSLAMRGEGTMGSEQVLFIAACALIFFLFSLGGSISWGPHQLLNSLVMKDSVRSIGRYQVGLTFVLSLLLSLLWGRAKERMPSRCGPLLLAAVVVLWPLNAVSFRPGLDLAAGPKLRSLPWDDGKEMREVAKVTLAGPTQSAMFGAIRKGMAVANCYSPLAGEMALIEELGALPEKKATTFSFIRRMTAEAELTASCVGGSYFGQNTLHLASSCPSHLCVMLNSVAPGDRKSLGLSYSSNEGLFCR